MFTLPTNLDNTNFIYRSTQTLQFHNNYFKDWYIIGLTVNHFLATGRCDETN